MPFLKRVFFHNTLDKWLIALAAAVGLWVILLILRKVLRRRLAVLARKTATPLDDAAVLLMSRIKGWFSLILSVYAGSLVLKLPPKLVGVLDKVVVMALLLQAAVWGTAVINFWVERAAGAKDAAKRANAGTIGLLKFFARMALWITVLLLALDNLGVQVTTLIAGLGVGGVAVALAVQNILGDLFASLAILLDKPFVAGDFIIVDSLQGTVEHIGLKTTRVRSLSGEQLIFANNDLLKSRIRNYKRMDERRALFTVGVVYETPAEKLAAIPAIVKDVVDGVPNARFERAHFQAIGSSSHVFEVAYWVTSPDYGLYMDVQQAINLELVRRFRKKGIAFAYPTQTLFVQK